MPHPATKLPQNICFEISADSEGVQGLFALTPIFKVKKRQTSSVIVTKNGEGRQHPNTLNRRARRDRREDNNQIPKFLLSLRTRRSLRLMVFFNLHRRAQLDREEEIRQMSVVAASGFFDPR
jgi:hypothetical protein